MTKGLVHIYCGDGKGKTTAATGLAVRAAGCGKKILFVQFLKGWQSGEVTALEGMPEVTVLRGQELKKFTWDMTDEELATARKRDDELFDRACDLAREGACDVLVFDEALGACEAELLDVDRLLAFMLEKPEELELVITGRNTTEQLRDAADYITEMIKIKHPYDQGIQARKGVEY